MSSGIKAWSMRASCSPMQLCTVYQSTASSKFPSAEVKYSLCLFPISQQQITKTWDSTLSQSLVSVKQSLHQAQQPEASVFWIFHEMFKILVSQSLTTRKHLWSHTVQRDITSSDSVKTTDCFRLLKSVISCCVASRLYNQKEPKAGRKPKKHF